MRQAELRLDAQLTAGIAADARAMQFLSFVAAIIVLLITAAIAALEFTVFGVQAFAISTVGVFGFIAAGYHSYHAAKPVPFEFAGGYPSAWAEDIHANRPFDDAIAEQLVLYDRRLHSNHTTSKASADALRKAAKTVLGTLVACGTLTFALVIAHVVESLPTLA